MNKQKQIKLITSEELEYAKQLAQGMYATTGVATLEAILRHNQNIKRLAEVKIEVVEELLNQKAPPDWKMRQANGD